MWMVRAGEHGRVFEDFKQHNIVAIGWDDLEDLTNIQNAGEIRGKIDQKYKEETTGWKAISASQVSRFRFDFKENDYVVTYEPESRVYLVGIIKMSLSLRFGA
jgi:restriction system protein